MQIHPLFAICSHRLMVRSQPFQGCRGGSNPLGSTDGPLTAGYQVRHLNPRPYRGSPLEAPTISFVHLLLVYHPMVA